MAVTLEIAFILVGNLKKTSLFAKKVCLVGSATAAGGCYRTKRLLSENFSIIFYMIWKLVSNSTVKINAIAFVIKYKIWHLFFTRPTDFNWKYLHFERDKNYCRGICETQLIIPQLLTDLWRHKYDTSCKLLEIC